jgi:hypothetical protein
MVQYIIFLYVKSYVSMCLCGKEYLFCQERSFAMIFASTDEPDLICLYVVGGPPYLAATLRWHPLTMVVHMAINASPSIKSGILRKGLMLLIILVFIDRRPFNRQHAVINGRLSGRIFWFLLLRFSH